MAGAAALLVTYGSLNSHFSLEDILPFVFGEWEYIIIIMYTDIKDVLVRVELNGWPAEHFDKSAH